ncbi:MAG: XTP/dITP diphosphatase [Actinomycetota bacterium]|nr:XTP/dITP diphosphatase [Actinomycetota bacterium]
MEIVVATRNRKKLNELNRMLGGLGVTLLGLDSFPEFPEVEETGSTFEENAKLKAGQAALFSGRYALADDSGLEVDALGGAPGVYSARYAGPEANDKKNLQLLLQELAVVPEGRRGARFRAVLVLADASGRPAAVFDGKVEGRIGFEPRGDNGFGYDPVFFPEGHDRTFAQMAASEKDSMSHRGRALEKLKEYLAAK